MLEPLSQYYDNFIFCFNRLQFVQWVCEGTGQLSVDKLCHPSFLCPQLARHAQRLLDKKTFVSVEDQLTALQTRQQSSTTAPSQS